MSNCEKKPTEFKINNLTTEQKKKDKLEEERKVKANREAAKKMEPSIAILNKLRIQHLILLDIVNKEKSVDRANEEAIKAAAKYTFNNIKNGDSVFTYPGILGVGWLTKDKEGYQLLMYADYNDYGDTAEPNPQYYIIYISKKGIIEKTFSTPSLAE